MLRNLAQGFASYLAGGSKYSAPNTPDHFWKEALGLVSHTSSANTAKEEIGAEKSEAIPSYYACIKVGSEDMMKTPPVVYDPQPNKGKSAVEPTSDPVAKALMIQPNPLMSAGTFRKVLMTNALAWGQGFAEIVTNKFTGEIELWPIHPSRVAPHYNQDTGMFSHWDVAVDDKRPNTQPIPIPEERMFRILGYSHDGINGLTPAQQMANSIGGAQAAEATAASLFGNGCNIRGALSFPNKLSDKAYEHLRLSMNDVHTGSANAYKSMILEDGGKFLPITMPMKDAQLLESRQFSVVQMSRIFRIIPTKIYHFEQAGYNSREQDHQTHKDDFILVWSVIWEDEVKRKFYKDSPRYVQFDMDSLNRGNRKERYEGHKLALEGGWKNGNEIRAIEGDNPKEDFGDEFYMTHQVQSEKNLHERHALEIEKLKLEVEAMQKSLEEPEPEPESEEEEVEGEEETEETEETDVDEEEEESASIDQVDERLEKILDMAVARFIKKEERAVSRHMDDFKEWSETFYTDNHANSWSEDFSVICGKDTTANIKAYFIVSSYLIAKRGEYREDHSKLLKQTLRKNYDISNK